MKKKITLIGGGSSAHALIPILSSAGHEINLLTSRPAVWKKKINVESQTPTGEISKTLHGTLNIISDDPAEVLKETDAIILCMPVSQYKNALNHISPHIDKTKKIYLGTIYGQGGFNWMTDEIKAKYSLDKIVSFAFALIPWVCRIKTYGETGIIYSSKTKNIVAVSPASEFQNLKTELLNDICAQDKTTPDIFQSEDFISLTLSVTNQIIHPARLYALSHQAPNGWEEKKDIPFFYRDFDDESALILKKLDNDYSIIREKIKSDNPQTNFKYMLDVLPLYEFYSGKPSIHIKTKFRDSKTLQLIQTPVVKTKDNKWELDKDHRFFTDDILYGLCIAKWYAEELSLEVPMIDKILNWAQIYLDVPLINAGKLNTFCSINGVVVGTPDKYNLSLENSIK